jgi:ion channel-forming bestrophin family protein
LLKASGMINYNPKEWFTFIFRFHKADTFRKLLPLLIGICIYSGLIAYLEVDVFKLSENNHLKNISVMHNLLGFAISMLLVFRTNTAYDRWWEGRKQWGALVNNSRSLAIKLSILLHDQVVEKQFFARVIPAFAMALRNHLRSEQTRTELFEADGAHLLQHIDIDKHVPNQVATLLLQRIYHLHAAKAISGDQMIILNAELQSFTDICGACERIKNTPIPFSYSVFLKKFIFIYVMTLPFGYVFSLGYFVIPVVAFVFYVLASLELIAEEVEDPFGGDANDVPTDKIAVTIQRNIKELLLPKNQ